MKINLSGKTKILAALLSAVLMLTFLCGAIAEETTLKFSYGDDAFYKHMLEIPNTTVFNNEKWAFEFDSLSFEGALNMYGGNTRTVWECTVPQAFANSITVENEMKIGTVTIDQPKPMMVYVFSGDRETGNYTLVDAQENVSSYVLDLYSSHDENGKLQLIDKVFLYCFREGGVGEYKYFAAHVYVNYENHNCAPADRSAVTAVVRVSEDPVTEQPQEETQSLDTDAYAAMVRILNEERTSLLEQIDQLQAEIDTLKSSETTAPDTTALTAQIALLESEKSLLSTQLSGKDTEITSLKTQIATLETENSTLSQQVTALNTTINELNVSLTAAQNAAADVPDLIARIEELEKENVMLRAGDTPAATQAPQATALPQPTVSVVSLLPTVLSEDPLYTEYVAYAYMMLDDGESMSDPCTLRGLVTNIDTAWSDTYGNISVTMVCAGAENMPILCYRLKGEGAQDLQVGDIITVEGILKNYKGTIELDLGCQLISREETDLLERVQAAAATPAIIATATPTIVPTTVPTIVPTIAPTIVPTIAPTAAPAVTIDPAKAEAFEMLSGTWVGSTSKKEGNTTRFFSRILTFWADGHAEWLDMDNMSAQVPVEWNVMGDILIIHHNGSDILFDIIKDASGVQLRFTPDGSVLKNKKYTDAQAANPTATPQPIDVTFKKGQQVEIFNREGVKISFTGTVEDKGMSNIQLYVLVENQTSNPVSITYNGTCNGWTVMSSYISGSASNVPANAKAEGYLWLQYEDLHISKFSDLIDANLTFTIRNGDSRTELFKVPGVHITFGTGEPGVIEPTYFEYYPELPDPTAYGAMYQSSRSGPSLINGVPSSSVTYKYRSSRSDELAAAFDTYIAALKDMGFSVSKSGTQYTISHKGKKIALASCSDIIKIEILANAIVLEDEYDAEDAVTAIKKNLGDTLSASMMTFKTEKTGKADKIYSYESKEPSWWRYYEAQSGSTFVYLKGTFTNKTTGEIDIRNVYTNLLINGENNYKGDVVALRSDGQTFLNYLSAKQTATVYVYFEVPDSVAASMKSAVVKLGFTQNFNTKVSTAGSGVYDFSKCSDVFEVDLMKKASSSSSTTKNTSSGKSTTLKITKQPTDVTVPIGETAKTSVEATGSGLSYQWYIKNPGDKKFSKSSIKKATYSYEMTQEKSGREVYCVITDSSGKSVTSNTVTMTAEKGSEPFMFQNVAWGSSPDKARTALVNAGVISSKSSVSGMSGSCYGMITTANVKEPHELPYDYDKVLYEDYIDGSRVKKKIGGTEISNIALTYVYGMKNGKLNKDSRELISINIEFENGEYNDLTGKLEALYGPCDEGNIFFKLWRGPDDTCMILYQLDEIYLLYGKWDNISRLEEMYDKLGYNPDVSDSSGL